MIVFNIACIVVALASFLSSLVAGAIFGDAIMGPSLGFFAIVYSFVSYRFGWAPTIFWVIPLPAIAGYWYVMALNEDFGAGGVVLGVFLAAIGVGLTYLPMLLAGSSIAAAPSQYTTVPSEPLAIPEFHERVEGTVVADAPAHAPYDQPVPAPAYFEAPAAAPVYEQPAPVYYEQPAQPAPVYQQPAPVYYEQPAPVYQQTAPVYYEQPAPIYQQPPAPVYQQQPAPAYQMAAPQMLGPASRSRQNLSMIR